MYGEIRVSDGSDHLDPFASSGRSTVVRSQLFVRMVESPFLERVWESVELVMMVTMQFFGSVYLYKL